MNARLRYLSTTLALLAVGLGYALIQGRPWRPTPRLEARPATVSRPAGPSPAPHTAREILARGDALSLTAEQKARLEVLDRAWKKETAGLEAALREVSEEFSRFMKEAQAGSGASLQEIQRRSAEVGDLSAALRERRRLHSEDAARVLTGSQRQKLAPESSTATRGGDR